MIIAHSTLYCVLLFYAYQMQIVKIKVSCEDHYTFYKSFRRVNMTWIGLIILAAISIIF